uniref:Prephenate dehydratase domain-containing protein n=1 Tax=Chromera velia CCMP2878 TaxID=1169474 RepID=A0A0G4F7H1_9ALVE|eukprot:Cvel_15617.t1-p1 / transcript=Cvel_15617.t1 / gene=Cvel_15617 / organism=Chromera_velia_CCMP2878 / gene_product=Bifunctional aspartate aminotransferase and, putative / transcript_product=Bifunctional aspartate aminotransferase and, putative / location=Cvel_scaffold1162:25447-36561(+) / protein_length=1163 / sequence_SO=supercontig / SO=protein_coding / is_pseudo=false
MSASRLKVAYQGERGSYSHKAVHEFLGAGVSPVAHGTFSAVFESVIGSKADYALVPIENTLGGSIHDNYDLMLRNDLHIVGEYNLRVSHCLLALPGVSKETVKVVLSHPQALAQCTDYLKAHGYEPRVAYDTAGSAKLISEASKRERAKGGGAEGAGQQGPGGPGGQELKWDETAAIASDLAAAEYGLQVLERGIQDFSDNFTRFILLSREPLRPPAKIFAPPSLSVSTMDAAGGRKCEVSLKTSIVLLVSHQAGALFKTLAALALRDLSLTKIESRPVPAPLLHSIGLHRKSTEGSDGSSPGPARQISLGGDSQCPPGSGSGTPFTYMFPMDVLADAGDPNFQCALSNLREISPLVRVLGTFAFHEDSSSAPGSAAASEAGGPTSVGVEATRVMLRLRHPGVYTGGDGGTSGAATPLPGSPTGKGGGGKGTVSSEAASQVVVVGKKGNPLRVGIVGFGNFGKFLAEKFVSLGARVWSTSRSAKGNREAAIRLGCVDFFPEMNIRRLIEEAKVNVLVLCMSIMSFEQSVKQMMEDKGILQALETGKILVTEVLSVKEWPKKVLMKLLPSSTPIVCTHPMFGPESGRHGWGGLPFVFEVVRRPVGETAGDRNGAFGGSGDLCRHFLELFSSAGCRMIEMSAELHDAYAGRSQFVTHLTGRVLDRQRLTPTPIDTKGFQSLLHLVDNTVSDSFDLFFGLFHFNECAPAQLALFKEAFAEIATDIRKSAKRLRMAERKRDARPIEDGTPGDGVKTLKEAMEHDFSETTKAVVESGTVKVHALTKKLAAEGRQVISMAVGEPDFLPPPQVMEATKRAVDGGDVRYVASSGTLELRKEVAKYLKEKKGVEYVPDEIVVSNGAKQCVYQAVLALCGEGEEVVIPTPCWTSYPDIVKMSGATPVFLETPLSDGFTLRAAALRECLLSHPKAKCLILCNPSNPTGAVIPPEELRAIAAVLSEEAFEDLYVIADEIYEALCYDIPHLSFASIPGMRERTVTINGFSKGFAMTGFRLGYAAADLPVAKQMGKLQGQITSCASSIAQAAGVSALRDVPEKWLEDRRLEMQAKRERLLQGLKGAKGIETYKPAGAFYLLPDVGALLGKYTGGEKKRLISTSAEFCEALLEEEGVALVPGEAFQAPGTIRISYATSTEIIDACAQKLTAFAFRFCS